MEGGSEKRKKKDYNNLNHSDIQERSLYIGLTSSDWKSIDISIPYLCLIAMQFNISH